MTMYYTYLKGNKRRYYIETTAALVLRYLTGAEMTPEDVAAAHAAMQAFDARKEGDSD